MLKDWLFDIKFLFFPDYCLGCNDLLIKEEKKICIACRHDLPIVDLSLNNSDFLNLVFYGRLSLQESASLFYFRKSGKVQNIVHNLKYHGREDVGKLLADWFGYELLEEKRFQTIDAIVPVPLHKKKLRQRGYNQLTTFGLRLAEIYQKPYVEDVLIRKYANTSQTFKDAFSRWMNVKEIFDVQNIEKLAHKHVLLIDDVVTTGATLEACALSLQKIPGVKISILTMAKAE
ncbi:MAG: amidophosphoribosyltransferase [Flavobacteriales bacterium CG_4_9_14_3_um_filter_40_17]|nr:MAG: amidophosphoribosyltransferase [Flavobacteriales bacterium CG_4_9_14_3_um_filter_40_17]